MQFPFYRVALGGEGTVARSDLAELTVLPEMTA
jgi:hypothetical protein